MCRNVCATRLHFALALYREFVIFYFFCKLSNQWTLMLSHVLLEPWTKLWCCCAVVLWCQSFDKYKLNIYLNTFYVFTLHFSVSSDILFILRRENGMKWCFNSQFYVLTRFRDLFCIDFWPQLLPLLFFFWALD